LTSALVFLPLALTSRGVSLRTDTPLLLFFAAIGFGFMFVEMAQMQRLIIFLGHPTHALSVVLFTLLLSSGLGSLATDSVRDAARFRTRVGFLLILLAVLMISGWATPFIIERFSAAHTPNRIAAAAGLLFPMGFLMGMPFPLGMRLGARRSSAILPWLWGVNGAASVCCSVLAVAVALSAGINTSFWSGVACYAAALIAYTWAGRRQLRNVHR
jgi:predicted membrane-bound spermidine synthase